MNNVYLGLTAIIGTVTLGVGLYGLIPQGMWLYLVATVWGTVVVTWSILALKDSSGWEEHADHHYHELTNDK